MFKINKGSIHPDHIIAAADRKDGTFNTGDLIRCEVIDINGDADKLVCGMKGVHQSSSKPDMQLGIITKEQLPKSYRLVGNASIFVSYFSIWLIFLIMQSYGGSYWKIVRGMPAKQSNVP